MKHKTIPNAGQASEDNKENEIVRRENECLVTKELPKVLNRDYDENGKLCGITILVAAGELPVTGRQFAQQYLGQSAE